MSAILQPPRVKILDDKVVNQIAAGEVVERPSSVVKELVENSLDASASEISVAITNGGKTSIEILDNGWGMNREDALFAVERFGTSKISSAADLEKIDSHGFRGEALPSIASVSRFVLETSVRDGQGTEIQIDGGTLKDVQSKGLRPGTKITVRQLFFNVPARKKFLRSENTEEGLIRNLLIDFAVAYPHVLFRFSSDGVERMVYPPGVDFFARAKELRVAGERPIQVDFKRQTASGPILVRALLSQPIECVAQAGKLRLLINRRSVRDKLLLRAIRDGYGGFLRPGRYPMGVLALELPPEDVDVNVHPQKSEVRFRRGELVFQSITEALKRALQGVAAPVSSEADTRSPWGNLSSDWRKTQPLQQNVQPVFAASLGALPAKGDGSTTMWESTVDPTVDSAIGSVSEPVQDSFLTSSPAMSPFTSEVSKLSQSPFRGLRYVGQVLACYLIFEGAETVLLMDMHAAHERIKFYRLKEQFFGGAVHTQQLLIPELVEAGPELCEVIERYGDRLRSLGFELDRVSETHLTLRTIPAALSGASARSILLDLFSEPEFADWIGLLEERIDSILARMACHRSIRSGRILQPEEAYALLKELDVAELSGLCPHGRPTAKLLAKSDFEAMFGRTLPS